MSAFKWQCRALAALVVCAASAAATAQVWPSRTVQAISPFTAGSANDVVARVVLEAVSRQLGQAFVVENRPGAGGSIGAEFVAKAAPDGYTILLNSASLSSQVALRNDLKYDPVRDFAPVAMLGISPSVLVAAPSKGWKSVADLVAAAKAKPSDFTFASAGPGSASHMAAERLRLAANIDVRHIPFRGPVEAFTEVISGRVDFYFLPIAPALANIRNGKVVALAVSTPTRAGLLPEVPTVVEAGYPSAQYLFWGGLAFPAGAPREIIDKLHAEANKALSAPAVKDRLAALGVEQMPMSVDEFTRFCRDDVTSTVKLARDINLVPAN
ncbi:MAG TPA: tripartite tricarboxylate transporter substrate binding protein [Burkholderiales bacterium]|nr:tripartite tricarboxylate transporter substrate binding protein [Burkholderiales bacterium]